MSLPFKKMNGLGNDFVIFDGRKAPLHFDVKFLQHVADRKRGVGCDQIIILEPATDADVFMRIFNPDGSEVEACGNATRCVGHLLTQEKKTDDAVIKTVAGFLKVRRAGDMLMTVDMGAPRLDWKEIPLAREMDTLSLDLALEDLKNPCAVNVGNPHVVFFVENAEKVDLARLGPPLETHALFPRKINVEVVSSLSSSRVRMRVWERATGITEACGSAACATVVAGVRRNICARQTEVVMDGGSLFIEWREEDSHILMTGAISFSFSGMLD